MLYFVERPQEAEFEHLYHVRLAAAAISDARQQWPLGVVTGHRIPVLYGSLVEAVKREAVGERGGCVWFAV